MYYGFENLCSSEDISHHGIIGQKWGVRRYQNPDGTLTAAGRKRYGSYSSKVKQMKSIANKISNKVKEDSKLPTGNQNCKLCTWCAEAQFRGMKNCLPRPVYSPRDPEFLLKGITIVKNPIKEKVKDFKDLESKLLSVKGDARFYTHVNWNNSTGGHEFLLIKSGNKIDIMDAQSGDVIPMKENTLYFNDINYSNSYYARLDNKELNKEQLLQVNNRKETLPFDPKLDIPFMYKEGMLSKAEYEAVMKNPNILYDPSLLYE